MLRHDPIPQHIFDETIRMCKSLTIRLSKSNTTDHRWHRKYQKLYQLNSALGVTSVVTSWINKKSIHLNDRYSQRHRNSYQNTDNKQQPWSVAGAITGAEIVTVGILRSGKWRRTNRNNTSCWMMLPEHRQQAATLWCIQSNYGRRKTRSKRNNIARQRK